MEVEDLKHPADYKRVQDKFELEDKSSLANQELVAELQKLRQSKALLEQEVARQQQLTEQALNNFKLAQARFRQMESERDRQSQAIEQAKAEVEQARVAGRRIQQLESSIQQQARQLAQARSEAEEWQEKARDYGQQLPKLHAYAQWLEQDRQVLQQNLTRFEQDLRALQSTRTVRAATKVSRVINTPLRLAKNTVRGPLQGGLDLPLPESVADGTLKLAGWAYSSSSRIGDIVIRLDDTLLGKALYGIARPDVVANRAWQLVLNCGFEANLELDRALFPDGLYNLSVEISDLNNNRQTYTRPVVIKHPHLTPTITPATPLPPFSYEQWIIRNEPSVLELENQRRQSQQLSYRPLLSILTPVYNTPPALLQAALESVINQTYDNWELCLVNGTPGNLKVKALLDEYARQDARIKIQHLSRNEGISGNTNAALAMAQGEFVVLLDHDDEISPNALYEVATALDANPELDFIYSDEDKYDLENQRCWPFFKPDWSPDLLRSQMYTCHLGTYRAELIRKLGGFRSQFDGAQDYDLVLRVVEQTNQIYHIPRILYHWRMSANSTAMGSQAKNYSTAAQLRAVNDYCRRLNLNAVVETGLVEHTIRVRRVLTEYPKVSIIIPTRDRADLVQQCIESIRSFSTYPNYEILLVDNDSQEEASLEYFRELSQQPNIRVLSYPKPFNFSAINNFAAAQAQGDILLLLNNDIEVISPHWLEAMVEHVLRPEVGAVGAKLLYPDRRLQHAGVIIGIGGVAGHSHKYLPASEPGYFSRTMLIQNLSAVTAACVMVRAEVYREVGGLDEKNLAVAFNDTDFCLRLREKDYLIVWTPYAELYHHESISRGLDTHPEKALRFQREVKYMFERWGKKLDYDPYYNPNLTLEIEDFSIAPISRVTGKL